MLTGLRPALEEEIGAVPQTPSEGRQPFTIPLQLVPSIGRRVQPQTPDEELPPFTIQLLPPTKFKAKWVSEEFRKKDLHLNEQPEMDCCRDWTVTCFTPMGSPSWHTSSVQMG
jgi:hypothetical protein